MVREVLIEFVNPLAIVRSSTKQKMKIAEFIIVYKAADMHKVTRTDEREEGMSKMEGAPSQCPHVSCRCIQGIFLKVRSSFLRYS